MARALNTAYGAFELKQTYQKNMLLGSGFAASLTAFCIFSIWIYNVITYDEIGDPTNVIRIQTIAELGAPPSLTAKPPQIDISKPKVVAPKVGIPTPVADDEVIDEDIVIATQDELQEINAPLFDADGDGTELIIDIPESDYMPSPDEFVAVEVQPIPTLEEKPGYPRLAQEGGFTAYVIVQAYVDKDGNVKKANAIKCSRPGMGFEEKAIAAALKCKYRPAIQNGNPIGVWISYRVNFELDN